MKLKIISDGTVMGSRVVDEEGRTVDNVTEVSWKLSVGGPPVSEATIKMFRVPIELTTDFKPTEEPIIC